MSSIITVADPEFSGGGGARNMKYKPPCSAAIFFYDYFFRPPESAIELECIDNILIVYFDKIFSSNMHLLFQLFIFFIVFTNI